MADSYNPTKLHKELRKAGLPVVSVISTGKIEYARELSKSESKTAQAVINSHHPGLTDEEIILDKIKNSGIKLTDLIFPLWLKIMHDDSKQADGLKNKIDQFLSSTQA